MRRIPVAVLSYRAYIYHLDFRAILLGKDCLDDIFRRSHIDFEGLLRIIIRCRRYHAAYMEHIIRPRNSLKHILIAHKVAPYHRHRRVAHIRSKQLAVLLAVAGQKPYIETLTACI